MRSLRRRRLLGWVAVSVGVTGCSARAGNDPILRLRNPTREPVEARITIHRRHLGEDQDPERSFDEAVSIDGSKAVDLEVFPADDSYLVVVERGDHAVEFRTRPICDAASTSVTFRSSGHVEYRVEFCEGNPQTGSSRES